MLGGMQASLIALFDLASDLTVLEVEANLDAEVAAEEARTFASTRRYHNIYAKRPLPTAHFSAYGRNYFTRAGSPGSLTKQPDNERHPLRLDTVMLPEPSDLTLTERKLVNKLLSKAEFFEAQGDHAPALDAREQASAALLAVTARLHPLGRYEAQLEQQLREETERYVNQTNSNKQADLERERRVAQHGGFYLFSPTHEAIEEELLARADAKQAAAVAKAWAQGAAYASLQADPNLVPLPNGTVKPHFTACGRNFFTTHAASKASTPSRDMGEIEASLNEEAALREETAAYLARRLRAETERELMQRDCRSLYALAAAWSRTRSYPDWHPRTANDFFEDVSMGRSYFTTLHASKVAEAAAASPSPDKIFEETELRRETAEHLARQDCLALASIARQWRDSKSYIALFPNPPAPVHSHFSAFGRCYFSTQHAQAERAAAVERTASLNLSAMEQGLARQDQSYKPYTVDRRLEGYLYDLNMAEQPGVVRSIKPRKIVPKSDVARLGRKCLSVPALTTMPAPPQSDASTMDVDLKIPLSPCAAPKGSPVSVGAMDFDAFDEIAI